MEPEVVPEDQPLCTKDGCSLPRRGPGQRWCHEHHAAYKRAWRAKNPGREYRTLSQRKRAGEGGLALPASSQSPVAG